jgi:hypothetical protein
MLMPEHVRSPVFVSKLKYRTTKRLLGNEESFYLITKGVIILRALRKATIKRRVGKGRIYDLTGFVSAVALMAILSALATSVSLM